MIDWEHDLDLDGKPEPFHFSWTPEEEDHQCSALGWFLVWRKGNPFTLEGQDGHFRVPVDDPILWAALKNRILDWAWAEKGGCDLEATHTQMLHRHHDRLKQQPASAGGKDVSNVRISKQMPTGRPLGERPRAKDDSQRPNHGPVLLGYD